MVISSIIIIIVIVVAIVIVIISIITIISIIISIIIRIVIIIITGCVESRYFETKIDEMSTIPSRCIQILIVIDR